MNKTTTKMNLYASLFIVRSIIFNVALGFAITALIFARDGLSLYAIIAIVCASSWVMLNLSTHFTWSKMTREERALYIAIRRHGKKIVQITQKELDKKGQKDILGIFADTDSGLEVQMIINGTGTFVNLFIGIKWVIMAKTFNNHEGVFEYNINE